MGKTGWDRRDGLIAVHQIQGVGWHTLDRMLRAGWKPDAPVAGEHEEEAGLSVQLSERIREKWTPSFIRHVAHELCQRNIWALTLWDEEYPALLRELPQPPWILYGKGDGSILQHPCLAVVGTRKPTTYGKRAASMLVTEAVAQGWTVVSGMAAGVDGEAHRGALEAGGRTAAVLGCGVDVVYPKHHRSLYERLAAEGLILSEAPPGTQPHPGLFPQRNRIISGLSMGVLVVEAAERSGSLITADFGMEQGREVFAVPGPITSEQSRGTNRLIQQGAKCVLSAEDIAEEFSHLSGWCPVTKAKEETPSVSDTESRLLSLFQDEPVDLEHLAEKMGCPLGEIHGILLTLQVKGLVRQLPGARFERKG
ncbi:DNA-processing protein DprA [Desmospora profundinema]|uniref:DNA processing protein n=1 Tax=Desmospora profundinema TaxID=1571184 RepID=A0ABU1II08_9BACL|nr:DNA-processing protein DprA [Desmospora profundinema]MDR6224182.1 DNA processing protein [Desmospora profundinema]